MKKQLHSYVKNSYFFGHLKFVNTYEIQSQILNNNVLKTTTFQIVHIDVSTFCALDASIQKYLRLLEVQLVYVNQIIFYSSHL